MIYLTEKAKHKIIAIGIETGNSPIIRAKISGGGCAGFLNHLDYEDEDKILPTDEVFDHDEVKIVVDSVSHQYLDGSTIDYLDNLLGGGFKFNNPNSTGSCGCGKSESF